MDDRKVKLIGRAILRPTRLKVPRVRKKKKKTDIWKKIKYNEEDIKSNSKKQFFKRTP